MHTSAGLERRRGRCEQPALIERCHDTRRVRRACAKEEEMRRALAVFLTAAISTAACADDILPYPDEKLRPPPVAWEKLPKEVTDSAGEVRNSCKENYGEGYEELRQGSRWLGISFITLDGKGPPRDIVVDYEWLCGGRMVPGNCSNRSCGLEIYKEVSPGK